MGHAVKWCLLLLLLLPVKAAAQKPIYPDSEAVILRIQNYRNMPVNVYIDPLKDERHFISIVLGAREAFLLLVSRDLGDMKAFYVTVVPFDPSLKPYRTGLLERKSGKLLLLVIQIGTGADSTSTIRS